MNATVTATTILYLAITAGLGYLGFKQTTSTKDFLLAGRQVHPVIMAISYGSTFISTAAIVGFGGAAASVNREKQRRMIRSARFFLPALSRQFYATRTPPCRFDVITIEPDGLNWLRGAFSC